MNDFFLKLGFKDITKEKPISFKECLVVGFDTPYIFSKRYIINRIGYNIEVLVGEDNYKVYYWIRLYGLNYKNSYSDIVPTNIFKDIFDMILSRIIDVYQYKIKDCINIDI